MIETLTCVHRVTTHVAVTIDFDLENPEILIFASKFKFFFDQNLDFVLGNGNVVDRDDAGDIGNAIDRNDQDNGGNVAIDRIRDEHGEGHGRSNVDRNDGSDAYFRGFLDQYQQNADRNDDENGNAAIDRDEAGAG